MRQIAVTVLCFSSMTMGWSQDYVGSLRLPVVDEAGFYNIGVTPGMAPYLNDAISNVRLFDPSNKEVPYLKEIATPVTYARVFKTYEILDRRFVDGCCTTVVLHNKSRENINNITIVVRNADVVKDATLLGSDDQKQWFALKDHFQLRPIGGGRGTSEVKIVDFPMANYQFLSLRIDDSLSAPLNILSAGYFEAERETGSYSLLPPPEVHFADSLKERRSYLQIAFDTVRLVDKLELSLSGQVYFHRPATLYSLETERGTGRVSRRVVLRTELNSQVPIELVSTGLRTKSLLLVIENDDNPPLTLGYVNASQLARHLTAFLKNDTQYTLRIGPQSMAEAVYDLAYFRDKIPAHPKSITPGEFTSMASNQMNPTLTIFRSKAFIWAAVFLAIAILGYMSVKLIRETKSSQG